MNVFSESGYVPATASLPEGPLGLPDQLWKEEIANALHVGKPGQLMDAGGFLLGLYFLIDGVSRKKWLNATLGAIMAWIHGYRFMVGDTLDPCLLCEASRRSSASVES